MDFHPANSGWVTVGNRNDISEKCCHTPEKVGWLVGWLVLHDIFRQAISCHRQGAPSFSTLIFHDFSMTKKWKSMTYRHNIYFQVNDIRHERIPELVVTVPSARSTIVKKIKWFIIWLYKWSHVTFTELLSAVVKIPWHYHHFHDFSMTFAIFHDFPGLENGLPKFHDIPWSGGTLHRSMKYSV